MKLYRGVVNCPLCNIESEQGIAYNGRTSMLQGLYLSRNSKYARKYGVLKRVDIPVKELGKIKHFQYYNDLETWYHNTRADGWEYPTQLLLKEGYDTVAWGKYYEVIIINKDLQKRVSEMMEDAY